MAKRKALSKKTRQAVYEKYNGHCAYCGCELKIEEMQVDHIWPLNRGGEDALNNYNPACRKCNFYKSTMTLEKFREQLEGIPDRLKKTFIFKLALNYSLVEVKRKPIKFYFEKAAKEAVDK